MGVAGGLPDFGRAARRVLRAAGAEALRAAPGAAFGEGREEDDIRYLSDPANAARIRRRLEAAVREAAATAAVDSANLRKVYEMALLVKLGFASRPEARAAFEEAWRGSPDAPHIPFRTELIDGDLWRELGRPKRRAWRRDEDQRPHRRYRFPWIQRVLVGRETGRPPRDIRELRKDPDPGHWRIVEVEHTTDDEPDARHFVNWVPYGREERDADIGTTLDTYDSGRWRPDAQRALLESLGEAEADPPGRFKPEDAFASFAKGVDLPMYRAMGQTMMPAVPQGGALAHGLSGPGHDMRSVMRELVRALRRMDGGGDPDARWMLAYLAQKRLGRVAAGGAPGALGRAARRVPGAAAEIPPPELAPLVALAAGHPDMGSFGAELARRSPMPTGDPEAAFRAALQGCYGGQGALDGASMVPLDRMPAWALEEAFGGVPESLDVFRAGYGGSIGAGRYVSTDPSHARLFMRPGMRLLRMDAVPAAHLRAPGPGRIVGRLRGTDREGVELVYWPPGTEARAAPAMTLGEFWATWVCVPDPAGPKHNPGRGRHAGGPADGPGGFLASVRMRRVSLISLVGDEYNESLVQRMRKGGQDARFHVLAVVAGVRRQPDARRRPAPSPEDVGRRGRGGRPAGAARALTAPEKNGVNPRRCGGPGLTRGGPAA